MERMNLYGVKPILTGLKVSGDLRKPDFPSSVELEKKPFIIIWKNVSFGSTTGMKICIKLCWKSFKITRSTSHDPSYIWTPLDTLGIHLLGIQGEGWAMAPRPLDSYLVSSHIHFLVSQISFQNNIILLNLKTQPHFSTSNRKRPGGTSKKKKHPHRGIIFWYLGWAHNLIGALLTLSGVFCLWDDG